MVRTNIPMSEEIKKGESYRKGYTQGIKEQEQEIIVLRSDIHRAIGFIQGLGHHDRYLEEKYKLE